MPLYGFCINAKYAAAAYRSNEMMGWARNFISLDDYLRWLTNRMPPNARVKGLEEWLEQKDEEQFFQIFSNKCINLDRFQKF